MFTQSSCKSGANHSNVTLAFSIIKCGQFVDEVVCVAGSQISSKWMPWVTVLLRNYRKQSES